MAEAVAAAQSAFDNALPNQKREAAALLQIARFKQSDVAKTMRQIEMETNGRFTIGRPMATEFKTQEAIEADGIIGIYRMGAGDGPV